MRHLFHVFLGAAAIGLFLASLSFAPALAGTRGGLIVGPEPQGAMLVIHAAPDIGWPLVADDGPAHAAVLRAADADQLDRARQVQAGRVVAYKAAQLQRQAVPRVTAHGGLAMGWTV